MSTFNNLSIVVDFLTEVPLNSNIKYEFDKELNMLRCDRILHTSMAYPGNYGYIPKTLSNDGDPIDVLMISDYKIQPMTIVKVKIIGVLQMKDEKGEDEKLIVVPDKSIDPYYTKVNDLRDIPEHLLDKIKHFFEHYKDTEPNKWVNVMGFGNREMANKLYADAKRRYRSGRLNNKITTMEEELSDEFEDFKKRIKKELPKKELIIKCYPDMCGNG
jgi:inorganic pyrophosphatase